MSAAWATVAVAALSLAAAALGLVVRFTVRWARLESKVDHNTEELAGLRADVRSLGRTLGNRLTWLERRRGRGE